MYPPGAGRAASPRPLFRRAGGGAHSSEPRDVGAAAGAGVPGGSQLDDGLGCKDSIHSAQFKLQKAEFGRVEVVSIGLGCKEWA